MDPISVLSGDINSRDIVVRLNAVKRLSTIAVVLGPEGTRTKLIPFLIEFVNNSDDEVSQAIATELGSFIPFVGGPNFAHCILPPLETLAQAEETVVRDQAVESLVPIAEQLPAAEFDKYFIPLVAKLIDGDWFTSKISAASLIPLAYSKTNDVSARETLRKGFLNLCEDDSPLVRRAASSHFGRFVDVVEKEYVESLLLPAFLKLANDDQESVQLLVVPNCVAITAHLPAAFASKEILAKFKGCIASNSWRVRCVVADHFVDMCQVLGEAIVATEMTGLLSKILFKETEPEAEVRAAATRQLKNFVALLPATAVVDFAVPAVKTIGSDVSPHVRSALSSIVMGIVPLCGQVETNSKLLPILVNFLKDEIPEVRLNIISNIQELIEVIGAQEVSKAMAKPIIELGVDPQWRVRLATAERMPNFAEHLGVEQFDEHFTSMCITWLGDSVFSVREAAIECTKKLSKIFGNDWANKFVVPKLVELSTHTNSRHRLTPLFACKELCQVVGPAISSETLLPLVLQLATDPVPNVRFNVCKTLVELSSVIGNDSPQIQGDAKKALSTLEKDSDSDVKFFATEALTYVG
eukprot:c20311_g1_i1.p1 GENE.c20311_g1_i1~~c20311_g1_i1.p1  ORF type:complete len:582 (-),score=211.56 c20311_g1_i1:50-1795(-)